MKEYLLLRDNTQSGPYSLSELKEIGLRSFDLVWIEGESFSWRYPSEITELAIFAPSLEMPAGQLINFSAINASLKIADKTYVKEKAASAQKAVIRHLNHIVAIEPKIEHIHVKTIKSTAQPNIVKVEIREKEVIKNENTFMHADDDGEVLYTNNVSPKLPISNVNANLTQLPATEYSQSSGLSKLGSSLLNNNKMEMVVLLIGAASLLAVVYLFITTGY